MDRDAHRRFLEYLELHPYFFPPHRPPMKREEWLALDVELLALEARPGASLSPEEQKRVRALRKVLLRD